MWKESARNLDELIAAVDTAYDKLDRITLDNVWLSVQGSMEDCLRVDGDNRYPLRHMGKAKLRREGRIPISIRVDPLLIARGQKLLDERPAIVTPVPARRRRTAPAARRRRRNDPATALATARRRRRRRTAPATANAPATAPVPAPAPTTVRRHRTSPRTAPVIAPVGRRRRSARMAARVTAPLAPALIATTNDDSGAVERI